jgi:sterol desaturase/sphingolipid hydroxylase (fatty acid hydroxylase superfamily)
MAGWLGVAGSTLAFAVLAGMVFVPLEVLFPEVERAPRFSVVDALYATIGAVTAHVGLALALGFLLAMADGVAPVPDLPTLIAFPLGFLLFELAGYAYHRAAHRVPVLWALHRVHHSSATLDWWSTFRQHPLEIVLMALAQNLPLVLLGVPLHAHAAVVLCLRLHAVLVHANVRIPAALDGWVVTPAFHRRHHGDGPVANLAHVLPWIDAFFGTSAPGVRSGRP